MSNDQIKQLCLRGLISLLFVLRRNDPERFRTGVIGNTNKSRDLFAPVRCIFDS